MAIAIELIVFCLLFHRRRQFDGSTSMPENLPSFLLEILLATQTTLGPCTSTLVSGTVMADATSLKSSHLRAEEQDSQLCEHENKRMGENESLEYEGKNHPFSIIVAYPQVGCASRE